ncbi:MAG: STAS domain-containing protein [Candidatus Cloacimonetes bacterium]|nr:STAS domain-containing protein [Candidatus Cloacimonadota bacterium]
MNNDEILITKETEGDKVRFILRGRVNINNSPSLQFELDEAMRKNEINIVLNMSQVYFLSSAGIRVILKMHKKTTEIGGSLGIEDPSENVRNVLGMTALEEMLV